MAIVLYFVGYVSIAELLPPLMSNLGGHVVLSLAVLAALPALLGVLAWDTGRSARPNAVGYMLSFVGAAVFFMDDLAAGIFALEFEGCFSGLG